MFIFKEDKLYRFRNGNWFCMVTTRRFSYPFSIRVHKELCLKISVKLDICTPWGGLFISCGKKYEGVNAILRKT